MTIATVQSFEQYLAHPAVNQTTLTELLNRTPAHARYRQQHPIEPTSAMQLGSAAHVPLLEGWDRFFERYAVLPKEIKQRRGKAYEAFLEEHPGRTTLHAREYQQVQGMVTAVEAHPAWQLLRRKGVFAEGLAEHSIYWTDEATGEECKARLDWAAADVPMIVDLKTTSDATPWTFSGSAARLRYYLQAAFYLDGANQALHPRTFDTYVIVAVEQSPPHEVAVYYVPESLIELGRKEYREALETYHECQVSGEWPGYPREPQPLELPRWKTGE